MWILQRVCSGTLVRRARPESRAPGMRLQTHFGILYKCKTRKTARFAETGMCLVSVDLKRPVPGDSSAICERSQLRVELQVFSEVTHPTTSQVDRLRTDNHSWSLLMDIFSTRVLICTQVITVSVELKQCLKSAVPGWCLQVCNAKPGRFVSFYILFDIEY